MMPDLVNMRGVQLLDLLQQAQRVEVAGTRADGAVEPRHRLEVVVVDVGPGGDDRLDRTRLAQEVGGQDLDRRARATGPDRLDAAHELEGAAVRQIVAVDRGDHDVRQAHRGHDLGQVRRLVRVDRQGHAPVLTLQKAQARVQVSPRIITVACFCAQHSPMFGQAASSQTVCRPLARISLRVS